MTTAQQSSIPDVPHWARTALEAYKASKPGRAKKSWVYDLACDWSTGQDVRFPVHGSVLRSIRNTFGPEWLAVVAPTIH